MNILDRYCHWLRRWNKVVIVVSLILAGIGFYYTAKLYKNLRTDMEELLPESAQSVQDIKNVANRVSGINHLSIVVEGPHADKVLQFQKDLAAELRKAPPELVARVEDNILKEKEFFSSNKALYLDLADWKDIENYVSARIGWEKKTIENNPFSLGLSEEEEKSKPQEYDFKALEEKYKKRATEVDHFPNGYFQSRDGHLGVVLAFLPGKVTDQKANEDLSRVAHEIVGKLNPKKYDPHMIVGYDGDVQNIIEEHDGLVEDLELSTVVVLVMVALVLLVYFRTFAGVYALCASLFAGTFITFGLSYYIVGYLNANTAFLGSIVVGNGINFGIIFLARYLEERRRGRIVEDALRDTMRYTLQATAMAATAAGLSYGSLMLTDFRGFNQFGIIGGLGMALCWATTVSVLPALLVFLENKNLLKASTIKRSEKSYLDPFINKVLSWNKAIVAMTVLSIIVCGYFCTKFSQSTLESDFSKLRNIHSMTSGAGYWGRKVDSVFERYLTPTAIMTESSPDATAIAQRLREYKAREGDRSPIAEIKVLEDFLPQEQQEKLLIMERLRKKLSPSVMRHMKLKDRVRVHQYLPQEPLKELTVQDLPEGIQIHFRERNGQLGHMVHVYPRLQGQDSFWDGREIIRFAKQLRSSISEAKVKAAIAGQPPLSADMIVAIAEDGPKATVFAFSAVALLVILVFRQWSVIRSVLAALLLGVLWMAGIMAAFDLKVNFLNFIALPITFGIGVDYAVNIFSRYQTDLKKNGVADIRAAMRHTGGAVALCSATTIIGYSSLLLASSQAFVSFGRLAVLGEITCLGAALIALPGAWTFFQSGKSKQAESQSSEVRI